MDAQQMNLDVITNNLANSSTTAFKRVQPIVVYHLAGCGLIE
jgi:flagellar basal-body rod protein FlgG